MSRSVAPFVAIALAALALSGCSSRLKPCPSTAILSEASSYTQFPEGAAPDPSHALYTAQITGVSTDCDIDKKERSVDSSLEITFRVSRAPNGSPLHGSIPYFLVVNGVNGTIILRRAFKVDFELAPGEATTTFTDNIASVNINLGKEKQSYDYQLLVGLQLTKAQLDYNRTVGRYTP
jgi:hypothetical protein